MHPRDANCEWCGFGPLMIPDDVPGYSRFNPHDCPGKPPLTPEDGAAVAFGIMGMAEAIRGNSRVQACPICLRASTAWVWAENEKVCMSCHDNIQNAPSTGHPYR